MSWNISKKLFVAMIVVGILPMLVFSFLTISSYQDLLAKQSQHISSDDQIRGESQLNPGNIMIQTLLILFLMAIFVVFFSIIFVKRFIQPIKKLTHGTEKLKEGNFKTKININSRDEFADLAESFNEMSFQLNNKIQQLESSKSSIQKAYTDLKKERKISERERRKISSIISNLSAPIIMVDNNKKISLINHSAKEIFNLSEKDIGRKVKHKSRYFTFDNFKSIIDTPFISRVTEKRRDTLVEEVIIPSSDNKKAKVEKIKYEQGDTVYKVTTIPVCDDKNCFGFLKIFYDLTQEKMIDELKSEFISIAAHQLRTPLTAIKWSLKMVMSKETGKLDQHQQELLEQGYRSNEKVIKLVNDMLNVSRIEQGRLNYSFDHHDIQDIVDSVTNDLEQEINNKQIDFNYKRPKKLPKIYMDKEKMNLVLQNLLENAIKFTPKKGKVSLRIMASKEKVTIKVKDNGVGIPKKNQDNLFTKFFQAENVKKMKIEGTGLGLFIVKNIVDKHRGDIECNSEEGKGTEFIVTLPLKNKNS